MAEMDEDGSGEVDFEEFYEWWTSDKEEGSVLKTGADGTSAVHYEIEPYN